MAHKCSACGSFDVSNGLHTYTCLECGAVSEYTEQPDVGRVPNPDVPATYATDPSEAKPADDEETALEDVEPED